MISSKQELAEYINADRIASNRRGKGLLHYLRNLFYPDKIEAFQVLLRRCEYYRNTASNPFSRFKYLLLKRKFRRLSIELGFSIPENVFGPGLVIPHYGTIVVNAKARIGANCRIHACTNIGSSGGSSVAPLLGDNIYIAPGAKIFGNITIASNNAIGANAVVNKSFLEEGKLIAGIPAKVMGTVDIKKIIKHLG